MQMQIGKLKNKLIELTEHEINEIVDTLDCGMMCFYNFKTREIKSVIDINQWPEAEEELWEEQMLEINNNRDSYIEFKAFTSHESFQVMVDFTDAIADLRFKNKLINALQKSKPFRNFKL